MADSIIEQSLSDFLNEIYYRCCKEIDVIEFQETENKLNILSVNKNFKCLREAYLEYLLKSIFYIILFRYSCFEYNNINYNRFNIPINYKIIKKFLPCF